jgi:hypothetical protein
VIRVFFLRLRHANVAPSAIWPIWTNLIRLERGKRNKQISSSVFDVGDDVLDGLNVSLKRKEQRNEYKKMFSAQDRHMYAGPDSREKM